MRSSTLLDSTKIFTSTSSKRKKSIKNASLDNLAKNDFNEEELLEFCRAVAVNRG